MIELLDTLPEIHVQPAEYKRLLGLPTGFVLTGRMSELAENARTWYAQHGRPWLYARGGDHAEVVDDAVCIDGVAFHSSPLRKMFEVAEADRVVLAAVSAGPELEQEALAQWKAERPDEYFFLEMYGSAVVEHLIAHVGARLCAWAEAHRLAVLPHYSPGYPEWDISEQLQLLDVLRRQSRQQLPSQIEVLESGMLRPKKSLLAVFGLTKNVELARPLTGVTVCENCSYLSCQYRRAPYQRALEWATGGARQDAGGAEANGDVSRPLTASANYGVNVKALRRWVDERLQLARREDGTIEALFRYDGTTCTNLGRPLAFDYRVVLGPREEGYRIREQYCGPAPEDTGHTYMCRYMNNAEHLMVAIDREKPLIGQALDEVLTWQRTADMAGCYCEPASRKYKWGLVLETIHFALAELDGG